VSGMSTPGSPSWDMSLLTMQRRGDNSTDIELDLNIAFGVMALSPK
jgi:hypothetical protein